jgi:hypothetical protein
LIIESEKLFRIEKEYVWKLLETSTQKLREMVYSSIIRDPIIKLTHILKDLVSKHSKGTVKKNDFYQNIDILNIWYESKLKAYMSLVQPYSSDLFAGIVSLFESIENFCATYIDNFMKEIQNNNDKIENENILNITSQTVLFLSKLLLFDISYKVIKSNLENSNKEFSAEYIIELLTKKLEAKSVLLKYIPMRYIFLINNVYFVLSKVYAKPFSTYISKDYSDSLFKKIKTYLEYYIAASWCKVDEITFNKKENESLVETVQNTKPIKNITRETIKKKFATFNEQMQINLKLQQRVKIVDPSLEKSLINENINYLAERYQAFYDIFNNSGFTKFRNKYIKYESAADVTQELKMYFSDSVLFK